MGRADILRGDRLYLRPLVGPDAFGAYPTWLNDAEACRGNSHHRFPYTQADASAYIRSAGTATHEIVFAIVVHARDRHIGNIALQRIRTIDRTAELSILIGDRTAWGRGYGTEAADLLCAFGFDRLGLHRISCGTFHDNDAMRKVALALGMREEGRRRGAAFKDGRFVDVIEYGVLREEFRARPSRPVRAAATAP